MTDKLHASEDSTLAELLKCSVEKCPSQPALSGRRIM
jgi:hypothetical protein